MKAEINQRVAEVRQLLEQEHLAAYIFPSTDPHHGEYVPDHWKGREWISGFNGSAGTAVVTLNGAALWTDSRYFLAAEEQLRGTEFQLMRQKMKGTPTIAAWIGEQLKDSKCTEVGLDGMVNSWAQVEVLKSELRRQGGLTLRTNIDVLGQLWKNRPQLPMAPIIVQPIEMAGESVLSKLGRLRKVLCQQHCDGMLVSALDDIAWLLNLRGGDVHCNPVFVSYLLVESESCVLFVNPEKLDIEVRSYLAHLKVEVRPYGDVAEYLKREYFAYNLLVDAEETCATLVGCLRQGRAEAVFGQSPIPGMKAIKNETEIAGFHRAMKRDGVALVKFLRWLLPAVQAGGQTEMSLDRKLTGLRAEQPLFRGISFDTIAGYAVHGAIVHYEATPETDIEVQPQGFILIDSGAQYQDGTTDITRTIALGPLTEEEKRIYTLVLKGHIQLELAKFPDGACGTQLDALAREAMWREGLNFMHGTGHGVGAYLNVHEGPHQIRMEYMPAPLHAGMTVTDEPGLYLAGRFGVRIENTLLVTPYRETEFGRFLQMEALTLCPIDTAPILLELLLPEERQWLNDYHRRVYEILAPELDEDDRLWLKEATQPI